jgi:hypothetical protein
MVGTKRSLLKKIKRDPQSSFLPESLFEIFDFVRGEEERKRHAILSARQHGLKSAASPRTRASQGT